jgi:hypothetical protein
VYKVLAVDLIYCPGKVDPLLSAITDHHQIVQKKLRQIGPAADVIGVAWRGPGAPGCAGGCPARASMPGTVRRCRPGCVRPGCRPPWSRGTMRGMP